MYTIYITSHVLFISKKLPSLIRIDKTARCFQLTPQVICCFRSFDLTAPLPFIEVLHLL